jgi:hypothetical protein
MFKTSHQQPDHKALRLLVWRTNFERNIYQNTNNGVKNTLNKYHEILLFYFVLCLCYGSKSSCPEEY